MINISTGGLGLSVSQIIDDMKAKKIDHVELSGGSFEEYQIENLIIGAKELNLSLHNYCLVPAKPFVLNLSSANNAIYSKSIKHIKKCIAISAAIGSKNYSFHAGYMIDPPANKLGKTFRKSEVLAYSHAVENFINAVYDIYQFSRKAGVNIFIENNVITKHNFNKFGQDILLMTSPKRIHDIFSEIPDEIGLLMDFGHLKVSAETLGFDKETYLDSISINLPIAYHLSDNEGQLDTNGEFDENSWFFKKMCSDPCFSTIEVYSKTLDELNKFRNWFGRKLK